MVQTDKSNDENTAVLEETISYLENRGFENIKADIEGYETPKSFKRQSTGNDITPDIVAEKHGLKYIFEVSLKSAKPRLLKTKWLLFDTLTKIKDYKFRIVTKSGHMKFTQNMIDSVNINKEFIRI